MNLTKVNDLFKTTTENNVIKMDASGLLNYSSAPDAISEFVHNWLSEHPTFIVEGVLASDASDYSSYITELSVIPNIVCYWEDDGVTFIFSLDGVLTAPENGTTINIYTKRIQSLEDFDSKGVPVYNKAYYLDDLSAETEVIRTCYNEDRTPVFTFRVWVDEENKLHAEKINTDGVKSETVFAPAE